MKMFTLPLSDTKYQSVPNITNLVSVLELHPLGKAWFIENHLNLAGFRSKDEVTQYDNRRFWLDFSAVDQFYIGRSWELCWLIRKKTHLRSFIDAHYANFHDFCIDAINEGNYIFVTVNTNYIPEYAFKWRHQIFIHGYNEDERMLYCSDYFGIPSKYMRLWIPYREIDMGYSRLFEISEVDDFDGVCLWNYDEDTFSFSKDFKCIKNGTLEYNIVKNRISAFLTGKSDSLCEPSAPNIGYGVTAIKWLKEYILEEFRSGVNMNMQPIFVIKDYVMVINDLICTMEQKKIILKLSEVCLII